MPGKTRMPTAFSPIVLAEGYLAYSFSRAFWASRSISAADAAVAGFGPVSAPAANANTKRMVVKRKYFIIGSFLSYN
jgi:hypothetical protein